MFWKTKTFIYFNPQSPSICSERHTRSITSLCRELHHVPKDSQTLAISPQYPVSVYLSVHPSSSPSICCSVSVCACLSVYLAFASPQYIFVFCNTHFFHLSPENPSIARIYKKTKSSSDNPDNDQQLSVHFSHGPQSLNSSLTSRSTMLSMTRRE